MFISDSIYLFLILPSYCSYSFKLDITSISRFTCKTYWYFNYSLGAASPMLLAYISVERYISMKYPIKKFLMRNDKAQLLYFTIVVLFNFILYLPIPIYIDLRTVYVPISDSNLTESMNETVSCSFEKKSMQYTISYLDMSFRAILPSLYMFVCTVLLLDTIFKTRKRIVKTFLSEESKTFHREIKLTFSSIFLNVVYVLLQLPISIFDIIPAFYTYLSYMFVYYLFFSSYSINFYIILFSNKLFHNEFFKLF